VSPKKSLAKALLCGVLVFGSMLGVPMPAEKIEEILKMGNQTTVTVKQRVGDGDREEEEP
jgi:hypothetical protein